MQHDADRSMTFYHEARVDGLEKRVETPTQMTEYFVNRDDFLVYRLVEFIMREKRFGPAEGISERPIQVRTSHQYTELSTGGGRRLKMRDRRMMDQEKISRWKMQDWKTTDHVAGVENDGPGR